jgi:hypothetical protein
MKFDNLTVHKVTGLRGSGRTTELYKIANGYRERGFEINCYTNVSSMHNSSLLGIFRRAPVPRGERLEDHLIIIDNFDYLDNGFSVIKEFQVAGCRHFAISVEGDPSDGI